MELITANNIIFALLSVVVLGGGLLSVLTEKLMHAAFYLFLTLVGIAGLYLQMSYDFLAAAQLSVYAGGILMLFIFAIVLVHRIGENSEHVRIEKKVWAGIAALSGIALVLCTMFLFGNFSADASADQLVSNVNMELIGRTLLGTGKHQYLLPFEATGILLLACIIGALVIANKEKEDKE
ncbi:MAG: NADH-quinone oxidoreductase subunit J [Paludibacteraceae bacterium]|nr:NADH-quinone oxidoreductase subunit J [Paludibacteraceae bacterium]